MASWDNLLFSIEETCYPSPIANMWFDISDSESSIPYYLQVPRDERAPLRLRVRRELDASVGDGGRRPRRRGRVRHRLTLDLKYKKMVQMDFTPEIEVSSLPGEPVRQVDHF